MDIVGTCKILIFQQGADEYILDRVKSKGTRVFQKGNVEKIEAISRDFHRSQEFLISGARLHLEWHPRIEKFNQPVMKIAFHLSQHKNFQNFMKWALVPFGECLPFLIDGKIVRLDPWVDVQLPFDFVFHNLFQPRGINERRIQKDRRTLYLGAYPKRTRVYEKKHQPNEVDYKLKGASFDDSLGVRIEVETHGRERPIQSLREIENLRKINPFRHLQFLSKDKLVVDDKLPMKTKQILWAFENRRKEVGIHRAIKEFNKSGNFQRTIKKHFAPLKADILLKAWNSCMESYLGQDLIVFPDPLEDVSFLEGHKPRISKINNCEGVRWSSSLSLFDKGVSDE